MDNKIPHYSRERLLGEGGMGKVYLAQDNQLQRQVAIKELTYQDKGETAELALQEARLLARVNHTNIIQIYNVHDEGEHISLVMEYFNSKTLTQFQHESHCTLVQKLDLLQQLAAGLAAAHKNNVIHCDLKPTNILVNEQGLLKITDFGIALLAGNNNEAEKSGSNLEPGNSSVTHSPVQYGSLLYMSPEQITQQSVDYRTDIFSLGIIAYQLMVGSHPFGRGSATDIAERICKQSPEHAKNLMLNAPQALTDLLMEMLIQLREHRSLTASIIENRIQHIRTALLQAEISEQATVPVNMPAEMSVTMPLTSVDNNVANTDFHRRNSDRQVDRQLHNTEVLTGKVTGHQKGEIAKGYSAFQKTKPLLGLIVICLVTFSFFWFYQDKDVETRQVVILKPSLIDSELMAPMQQDLVTSAVEDALRQAVINTKNMYLISQREVKAITKAYPDDLKKLQQAVGASDIISTTLACNNNRCKVSFSRLVVGDSKNLLSVKSEKNWLVPIDKFNAIFSNSQAQFVSLFPEQSEINQSALVQKAINEKDYHDYIALYNQIKGHGSYNPESLAQLEALLTRSPYLYAAYALYSETASNLYVDSGDISNLKRLEQLLPKSPPEYRYSLYHAIDSFWLAFNLRDFTTAEKQIAEAKNRGASHLTLAELNGILYFSKGQYQQAVNIFKKALTLRPNTALLYNLALSYWNLGDLKLAENTLIKMLTITPNNYKAIRLQANIWLFQGKLDQAITAYTQLVANLGNANDISNLSLAYGLNKQYAKSLEFSLKALEKNQLNPINLLNLADIEMILGDKHSAELHYQNVIDILIDTKDVKYLTYLAQAYGQLQQANLAIEAINKAQALSADSGEVSYSSAIVYSLLKENSSAIHHTKMALKKNVDIVWFNLPWFDKLCNEKDFLLLMQENNNTKRCEF